MRKGRKKMFRGPLVKVPEGFEASYKRPDELKMFMTSRGKILPRSRTTLSQKRQRQLVQAIKRSRHLAMLPYVSILK